MLSLSPHVLACAHDGQVVLLDLKCSRYLGLGGPNLAVLAAAVAGWPQAATDVDPAMARLDIGTLTAPLLRQGLLTRGPMQRTAQPALPEAAQSLNAEDLTPGASPGHSRIARFVGCAIAASMRLRLQSLQTIAHRVGARRRQAAATRDLGDVPALRAAVADFIRLRPLLFSSQDRCLHDSLALLGFLAGERWFPHWVIGVTTRPFGAHAWVQSGDLVLSDLHENVRRYTPILVA